MRKTLLLLVLAFGAVLAWLTVSYVEASQQIIDSWSIVGSAPIGIVFGASVLPDKPPSAILRDRVATGVDLLKAGRVQKLILSGDNRETHYNEVAAMRRTALELGALPEELLLDNGGVHTYDSCLRARDIFGASDVILVTQRFHLPRAVYTCSKLGLRPLGVAADRSSYDGAWRFHLREWGAWLWALVST
jgi:vancomycin permeability regulator SanA